MSKTKRSGGPADIDALDQTPSATHLSTSPIEFEHEPPRDQIPANALRDAIGKFLAIDVPWIHGVRPEVLAEGVERLAALRPETVLGAHLPPARDMIDALSDAVLAAPSHVDPDQSAFERMLRAQR